MAVKPVNELKPELPVGAQGAVVINQLIGLAFYLAVGLLVYLLAYGPVDWSDAWVYVIAILWPFVLVWWWLFYIIGFVLMLMLPAAIVVLWDCLTQ